MANTCILFSLYLLCTSKISNQDKDWSIINMTMYTSMQMALSHKSLHFEMWWFILLAVTCFGEHVHVNSLKPVEMCLMTQSKLQTHVCHPFSSHNWQHLSFDDFLLLNFLPVQWHFYPSTTVVSAAVDIGYLWLVKFCRCFDIPAMHHIMTFIRHQKIRVHTKVSLPASCWGPNTRAMLLFQTKQCYTNEKIYFSEAFNGRVGDCKYDLWQLQWTFSWTLPELLWTLPELLWTVSVHLWTLPELLWTLSVHLWILPELLWTVYVHLWTLPELLWTLSVHLWTLPELLWTLSVHLWTLPELLWTVSVHLWTLPELLWTISVHLWTLPELLWTVYVHLWTLPELLWTLPELLWTVSVHLWTLTELLWTVSVHLWTLPELLWTLSVHLWTLPELLWTVSVHLWTLPELLWTISVHLWILPELLWILYVHL